VIQRRLALPVLLAAVAAACAAPRQLTILHVNDMHTHYLPEEADWVKAEPKPLVGGMVALQDAVAREKAASQAALVLDAGDWLTGTPISDIEVEGVKGGAFMQMMNAIGFDAATIGNHDFDNGQAALPRLVALADFPVVSANLLIDGRPVATAPWVVVERGGLRVGVVGLIMDDLAGEISRETMRGVEVKPVAATAQAAIRELDPVTDLIVLLTHLGWEEDSLLATRVSGADVIVGGHSHTRIKSPREINGALVVQAGSYTRELGRLDLTVEDDRVAASEGKLISLWAKDVTQPDAELAAQVQGWQEQIDREFQVVIGQCPLPLERSYYNESPLGNVLCDALRELAGTDVALLNSGGLRADLDAGPVTRLDLKEILPFQNTVVTFTCSGAQLMTMLENNARASLHQSLGVLQVSGLSCAYRERRDRVEIQLAMVGGQPLDPRRTYTVATVDYVLSLADKYLGFRPETHEAWPGTLFSVVCDWVKTHPLLRAPSGGRFTPIP
jgi:2',3'-cyclic-nucleotide 2'-phosphodiesterase (5'-nucleotidase family)